MNNNRLISIDLAKNTFQVCGLNQANKVNFNRKITRAKLTAFIQQQESTLIAMEACGSSNYWGRRFQSMGHQVKLVPAQHVKPFVKGNKNDHNDALAIAEAALRPNIKFVPIKSTQQQDLQMVHRIRQHYVKQKNAVANQLRAYLLEYGIVIPKQIHYLIKKVPELCALESNNFSSLAKELIQELYSELLELQDKITELNQQIAHQNSQNEICKQLQKLPGIGPLIASALYSAVGNGSQFTKGRQMSAWIGLTPAHFGTGGKNTNVDTTKKGDQYLRTLIIHGARTVVTWTANKTDPLSLWIQRLVAKRGKRKTYVALANKLTRAAWHVLRGESFNMEKITAKQSI